MFDRCPRLDCQHPAQTSGDDGLCGECPACGFVFCTKCERTFHGPTHCDSHGQLASEEKVDEGPEKTEDEIDGDFSLLATVTNV